MSASLHPAPDRWLDLVNGLLQGNARAEAIAHAERCAPCRERMRECAAAHERTQARATRQFARRRPARAWAPLLAAAAGLVVVFVSGALLFAPTRRPVRIATALLPAPDASILTRDGGDSLDDGSVVPGLEAYRRADYAEARRLLETAHASGPLEQVRRLYLGNSLLQQGDARGAIRTLRSVDRSLVPEPWLGEMDWSLAVALATMGDRAPAESLRRILAERPDDIGARARRGWAAPRGVR